ncbi:hypothetical protein IDJ75_11985 [Mucilaginibacter rigui]|uniref:Hedgehog/Intein (Hint) domain-containing protein n=1 Tax=Mucilaginibacter rigui TaxID=534635 RepID=A0ABR7X5Y6_9SPHI|nr:hypothetical protein [Mucilaginibacter rigui]MBD1386003.1 hypothetical protein [Mucilaginibacter rigui]
MAFAYGTSITTPNGTTPIEQLTQGNIVSAWTPDGTVPKAVIFSDGTPGGFPVNGLFFLEFGEGSLIVTRDQPFVLADNTVKKTTQLRPGDQLLKADGQTVMLQMISTGQWDRGLHGIAIDSPGQSGNHLIIADGIVCGDYVMEMMPSPPDDSDDMPLFGE